MLLVPLIRNVRNKKELQFSVMRVLLQSVVVKKVELLFYFPTLTCSPEVWIRTEGTRSWILAAVGWGAVAVSLSGLVVQASPPRRPTGKSPWGPTRRGW